MTTKTALLTHAEALARTRGFDAFSYADLARAVGIQKASVHHHFRSKGDLAGALITSYSDRFFDALDALTAENPTGGVAIAGFLGLYRDALQGGEALCLCAAFSACRDSLPEQAVQGVEAFRKAVTDWLTQQFIAGAYDYSIRSPGVPQLEAAAAFALVEGAQLVAHAARNPTLFDTATATLRDRIQTGVR